MRTVSLALAALLATGVAAHAQDVRGVIENLNRAINPQQQQEQQRDRDRQIRTEEERYWRDYYGNRIPSRHEVRPGYPGSAEYVERRRGEA